MTISETLKEIKRLAFGDVMPPASPALAEPAPAKMESVTTVDGVVLEVDKKDIGGSVMISGVAAPDGDYTLEGGTVLKVTGGLIAEIVPAAAEQAPASVDQSAVAMAAFRAEFDSFKGEFTAHKEAFAAVQNDLSTSKAAFAQLMQVVETMSQASIQPPTVTPASFAEMTPIQKFRASKHN